MKLVRDKIPEIIKADNKEPIYYYADREEYEERLLDKLKEEIREFIVEPSAEEMGDIREVLRAIANLHRIKEREILTEMVKKREKSGEFSEKVVLVGVNDKEEIK